MNIGQEQQILVEIGALEFCIDLNEVLSIINPPKMVRLPAARGAFTRAFKYQDELGAAVSVRLKFELDEREDMQSGQLLLGRINERLAGFWFDKVVGILKLGDDLELYQDSEQQNVTCPEIDQLFVYKQRLIPHISLSGILSFHHAAEWKQWLETDKPGLERALQAAAQAQTDAVNAQKALDEQAAREQAPKTPLPPMALEEFYALMDDAGVGVDVPEPEPVSDPEIAIAQAAEVESDAGPVARAVENAELGIEACARNDTIDERVAETVLPAVDDIAPDSKPGNWALAVPVGTTAEDADSELAESGQQDDALFALEKKSEAYRQRMDDGQEVDLTEYQIIKVGDKGLFRRIRRWFRRLIVIALLLVVMLGTLVSVEYVGLYGNPVKRLVIQNEQGEMDWGKSYAEGRNELKRYANYVLKYVQRHLPKTD